MSIFKASNIVMNMYNPRQIQMGTEVLTFAHVAMNGAASEPSLPLARFKPEPVARCSVCITCGVYLHPRIRSQVIKEIRKNRHTHREPRIGHRGSVKMVISTVYLLSCTQPQP